jgi:transitional endoplasmic reticulum ATPase
MTKENDINLKVGELTNRGEFGRGIVRLDSKTMAQMGVREGDVIEITGKKKTGALAVRSYPADVGLNLIRMDGLTRKNADVGVGEVVKIKKADLKEAKNVVLAPVQKGIVVQGDPYGLKKNLFMRPVAKGDILSPFSVVRQQYGNMGPFEEIFRSLGVDMADFGGSQFSPIPGGEMRLAVVSTMPEGIVKVTEETDLELRPEAVEIEEKKLPTLTYEDIGGLGDAIQKIREMVELPLRHPELFEKLGIDPPKGILLYGPPGTGKTLLARAVANESGASFYSIGGPEIFSKWYGQTEENLRKIFEEAEKNAPSIIFVDEIDAIAPKREEVTGEVEKRTVSQLLTLMDGLKSRGKIVVIAATNIPNSLDPALRRPGRFDREVEIGVPDQKGRKEILQIHTRNMPLDKDVDLNWLASVTYGFVGADLAALSKEAAMSTLRRNLPQLSWKDETQLKPEVIESMKVTKSDFENGLKLVEPSAMREVMIEIPKVKWKDIGGLDEVKQQLQEVVEWPLKNPESFEKMGIHPPKGVLLYGPPGTGKTMLAKAVANESGANFISVKGPEMFSKWVGESEKHIRDIFRRARQVSPSIIFFDEMDALAPRRGLEIGARVSENVVSQILTEISGLEDLHNVVVIAATNRPDILDPALLRPGRFDRHILVPSPDSKTRLEILKIHTAKMPLAKDVNLKTLSMSLDGYTGADIENICREAGLNALRENMGAKEVRRKHFARAIEKIRPSVTPETTKTYKSISDKIGSREAEKPKDDMSYVG